VATGPDGSLRSRSDSGGGQPVDGGASPRAWQRPLAWTVAAGALLGGLAGGTALWIRSGAISDANKLTCNVDEAHMTVMPPDKANGPRCEQFASKGAHAKTAALISFSAAGALAIAAVVLFATAPSTASASSSPATARSSLACAPSLAATGVACQLRF